MRLHGITVVLVIAVALQVVYGLASTGHLSVLGRASTIDTTQLLTDTNREREIKGLAPLSLNQELNNAAELKAQDMLTYGYWAHTSPTGVTPWYWLSQANYYYDEAGENLAKNYPNASSTVAAWMASDGHRANILNDAYTDVGFAVAEGYLENEKTTLVVAYYGAPAGTLGVNTQNGSVYAPGLGGGNPFVNFSSSLQALNPASLIGIGLFALIGAIALAAHHYRDRLPKAWRNTWRAHHGMLTFIGMVGMMLLIVLATGGGQL